MSVTTPSKVPTYNSENFLEHRATEVILAKYDGW